MYCTTWSLGPRSSQSDEEAASVRHRAPWRAVFCGHALTDLWHCGCGCELSRGQRDIEREKRQLEREEKRVQGEIKKAAKKGDMVRAA